MSRTVEVNANKFRKMLWENNLTDCRASLMVCKSEHYFGDRLREARYGYAKMAPDRLKAICGICNVDPEFLQKKKKSPCKNDSDVYEQESLVLEEETISEESQLINKTIDETVAGMYESMLKVADTINLILKQLEESMK